MKERPKEKKKESKMKEMHGKDRHSCSATMMGSKPKMAKKEKIATAAHKNKK
jgi:hypothetical protein